MEQMVDLESLSEEERNIILSVMRRDEEMRHGQENRACEIKHEIQDLRMKSVLRNGDDLSKMCARCKSPFGFFLNTGDVCPVCRFRVCKVCRETTLSSQGWMCTLCFKENQLRWLSSEWLDKEKDPEEADSDSISTHPDSGIGGARDHPTVCSSPLGSQYSGGPRASQRGRVGRTAGDRSGRSSSKRSSSSNAKPSVKDSIPEREPGDHDDGIPRPVVDAEGVQHIPCRSRRDSSSESETEEPVNRGTVGNQTQVKQKHSFNSKTESAAGSSKSKAGQQKVRKGKEYREMCVDRPTLTQDTDTGELPKTREKDGHKEDVTTPRHNTADTEIKSSGCSFTSSELADTAPEEGTPDPPSFTSAPTHNKKEEESSAIGQSSGYISSDRLDNPPDVQKDRLDSPPRAKSGASASNNKHGQQKNADVLHRNMLHQMINNAHATSTTPVIIRRQPSVGSETFSSGSARTASPHTKIRLLDLASNRALERDGTDSIDSLQSWSGGSEDTLSLGLSCSGLPPTARPPVFRNGRSGDSDLHAEDTTTQEEEEELEEEKEEEVKEQERDGKQYEEEKQNGKQEEELKEERNGEQEKELKEERNGKQEEEQKEERNGTLGEEQKEEQNGKQEEELKEERNRKQEEEQKEEQNGKQEEEQKEERNGKQAEKVEEEVVKYRSGKPVEEEEEEADTGGDSAYSTAGSVATSIHTDHGMEDPDTKDDGKPAGIYAVPGDDTACGPLDATPVTDSMENDKCLSESAAANDEEAHPGSESSPTRDVDMSVGPGHVNNADTVKGEDDVETDQGSDSCGASYGSHEEDTSNNKTESSEDNESLAKQRCPSPADEDNPTEKSLCKNVPTLEEQIAEVQKMRNPSPSMSFTMQRYFQVDDSGSDTLSIISERTEPEDREDETDREYAMYNDEDSDSDGTLHDDLDGQWSDDCDDIMDAGATTPRKLSATDVDEIELQDLRQRHENHDLLPEHESEPETPKSSEEHQGIHIDCDPNDHRVMGCPEPVQVSPSPERLSSQDTSVHTDHGSIPQQDTTSDPLSQEEDLPTWSTSSEDSATQTEEVVFISKEQQELLNQLLAQQDWDAPRLYRSFSEDWTQTDLSPKEDSLQNSELCQSKKTSSVSDLESVGVACEVSKLVSQDTEDKQENDNLNQNGDDRMHSVGPVDQSDSHVNVKDNSSPENLSETEENIEVNTTDAANSAVSEAVFLDNDDLQTIVEEDREQINDDVNGEGVTDEKSGHVSFDPHVTEINGKADNESHNPDTETRTPIPDYPPQQEEDQAGLQSRHPTHPVRTPSPDDLPESHDLIKERPRFSAEEEYRRPSLECLPEADVDLDDLALTDTSLSVSDCGLTAQATAGDCGPRSVEDELSSQASGGQLSTAGSAEGGASYSSASALPAIGAHESEIQPTSTPDRTRRFAMDHVDDSDQSDMTSSLSYAQRSNSTGDLLRDSKRASKAPSMSKAFTGSVDQLNQSDNIDGAIGKYRKRNKLSRSKFSLAASRESLASVYSDAGEINYGRIPVSGEITFGMEYDQKQTALRIHIKGCQDLAPVDIKHNRSDPYVKVYLLPDKTRAGKRKSKIKKHTLNPVYNETLSYAISPGELETRTLWVTVWHSDRFGRNDFLGEVNLPMDVELFDDTTPRTYTLESRLMADGVSEVAQQYRGDLILSLMYVTADKVMAAKEEGGKKSKSKSKKSKPSASAPLGQVHVMIKSAKHLTALRSSGASDPFVKGYLLPERGRGGKQKTPVVKNSVNPMWNHILIFEGVDDMDLADRGLELTIWDHEKLGTNQFLGGVRLNLGLGVAKEQPVEWMDGRGEEIVVWQNMMERPNTWIDTLLPLRASMGRAMARK